MATVLAIACATLLVAALWVQRTEDTESMKRGGPQSTAWAGYEAQLDYARLRLALEACAAQPNCFTKDVVDRAHALLVRLEVIGKWEDKPGALSPTQTPLVRLRELSSKLATQLSEIGDVTDGGLAKRLLRDLTPLGTILPGLLADATVAQGADTNPAPGIGISLILLLASAAALIALLFSEERRRAQLEQDVEGLRQLERRLRGDMIGLVEALPTAVLIMSNSTDLTYANRAAIAMARPPRGFADVRELALLVGKELEPLPDAGARRNARFDLSIGEQAPIRVNAVAQSMRLFDRDVVLYMVADETALREAETRAMSTSHLAMLGELSVAIVHELNQPLSVIGSAALNGKRLDPLSNRTQILDKFDRIGQQIERARHIMDDVRQLGRADKQALKPFSIARAVDAAVGLIRSECGAQGVALDFDERLDPSVVVHGTRTLFEIAVLNILLNAAQAHGDDRREISERRISVETRFDGHSVVIQVTDNAGGIPKAILERVFEPFVSSKPPERGTGVGLSVARRAVTSMGGTIEASNIDGGAVISIRLPVVAQEIAA